jgi:Fic family protein
MGHIVLKGKNMQYRPKFKITNKITTAIGKIERARGFFDAINLSQELLLQLQNRALVLEAYHTTHIEGTQLTLEQSKKVVRGEQIEGANPDDIQEVKNYTYAFNLVSEYLNDGSPVTESLIREIHKKLVCQVRGNAAAPGEYRKIQNYVVNSKTEEIIYTPPPAYEVGIMMQELIEYINKVTDSSDIIIAGIAQFQLVHIHPFLDGNGRTARLLSTLCLYKKGYDFKKLFTLSEYYDRNRLKYYEAMQSVRNNDMDMTAWLEYFTDALASQISEIQQKSATFTKYEHLKENHRLSERQINVINYIMEFGEINIRIYEILSPNVSKRTLQRELKELVDMNLLDVKGSTNNKIYTLKLVTNL